MGLAHFGVGILVFGVVMVTQFEIEKEFIMSPKETVSLASYTIEFKNLEQAEGSNYVGITGKFVIKNKKEKIISELYPEKRHFVVARNVLSETAIDAGFWRDIYITLGENVNINQNSWSIKLYYKPFVRWIWGGALMIAIGAFLAALKREKGKKS